MTTPHAGYQTEVKLHDQPPGLATRERDAWVESLAERVDRPLAVLGFVFLGIVIVESFTTPPPWASTALTVAGWVIWAVFAADFGFRLIFAGSKTTFLRRNWWQLLFLAVPFLRALRLFRLFRVARAGRVVSSAVRTTRSAERTLTTRLAWAAVVHISVVLASAQLIVEFTPVNSALDALYLSARAAVNGEPLGVEGAVARVLEVSLATYAVVIFASLAGTLGAFFLERKPQTETDTAVRKTGRLADLRNR